MKIKNVIEAIEEKMQKQKDDLFFKDLQIKELIKQLEECEAKIKNLQSKRAAQYEETGATE